MYCALDMSIDIHSMVLVAQRLGVVLRLFGVQDGLYLHLHLSPEASPVRDLNSLMSPGTCLVRLLCYLQNLLFGLAPTDYFGILLIPVFLLSSAAKAAKSFLVFDVLVLVNLFTCFASFLA